MLRPFVVAFLSRLGVREVWLTHVDPRHVTTDDARQLCDSELRQELLDLLREYYIKVDEEMPEAMYQASTEQLRRYWNASGSDQTEKRTTLNRMPSK